MPTFSKTFRRSSLLAALFISLAPLSFPANKLTITPTNPRQLSNSTLRFTASIHANVMNGPVTWSSSNPTVATIAGNSGTANAELLGAGTTTITAMHGGQKAATLLTVTIAANPVFTNQPTDTNVSAVINSGGGVMVQLLDNLGDPLAGQNVTVSIGTNSPGTGTLSGTLTRATDRSGIAIFSDLKIDWLGNGYTLIARANPTSGAVSAISSAFNELRIGDVCLGPDTPACNGACPDADGDGLNDAWEKAGGVDINGDGLITDSTHDLLLAGADPDKPDIFVQYDWMDYATPGNGCSIDSDCTRLGLGHRGETCTGPQLTSSAPASCRYACSVDSDCTARGPAHAGELCRANSCVHTHDPSVTAPNALQAVVDRFAAHGINLHLIRGNAQPHSTVLSFRLLSDPEFPDNVMIDTCEGGSVASGDAGMGKYAESIYDLKQSSSLDKFNLAYHYTVFSHYSACDTSADCLRCGEAHNPDGSPKNAPAPGESGLAEISGNDFIVSLGNRVTDLGIPDNALVEGGTFMHELGHNLGLHHGGGIEEPCQEQSQCHVGYTCTQTTDGKYCQGADDTAWKPNYLSVMNYRFQFTGIQSAAAVGSIEPTSSRLDYSSQTLPTGGNTPGALEERNANGLPGLNEPAGLGSGTADLTSYFQYDPVNLSCISPVIAPTDGPVDFDGDGATTTTNATADLNGIDHLCGTVFTRLGGATDWPELSGLNFTYGFQCTPFGGPTGDGAVGAAETQKAKAPIRSRNLTGGELSPQMAMDAHVLFPSRSVKILIHPGCSSARIPMSQTGIVQVAVLGDASFDVSQVEPSSLKFAGAAPVSATVLDVNGDGVPDLLLTIDAARTKLTPHATRGRLSGWLRNSQAFFGEQDIRVVSSLAGEDFGCR